MGTLHWWPWRRRASVSSYGLTLVERLLHLPTPLKMALQVAVEILVLSDRDEINNVPLVVDDVCDEPLVVLGLEFFHPDLAQGPALPVSSVGVLKDLRLHFVEPVNDGWREAFAILVVTWSGEPGIWHLPPPPLDGLGKPRLDLGRPFQDLLN
jgi:hypothetical protein